MSDPEADRDLQVFMPIESKPNALTLASNSQQPTASNSPLIAPQVPEGSGDIRDRDSTHNNPTEFPGQLSEDFALTKLHSSASSSSVDGVFCTAPETPTRSVDYDARPGELLYSSSGPYNAAEGPSDKRATVRTSPAISEARKSETSENRPEQFSSVNRDSQEPAMAEPEQVVQTSTSRIGLEEESITGARLGLQSDTFPNDSPAFSQPRRRNRVVQTPRSGRRHAIPIIRPPTPGSEEPPLERYDHGLDGVPSHYIPLYGSLHGMFYDPIIKMFVGDGLPRSTPERPDGSVPCVPENTEATVTNAAKAPTTSTTTETPDAATAETESRAAPRRSNPDDALHIQPRSFIDDFNVVPQPVGDSHPLGHPAPGDGLYPAGRPPNEKLYFCRCTGQWLSNQHECHRGPMENMPEQSGLAITTGTQLPEGWVTHRIVADPRMYPGGVVPEQTAAGPMVGGQPAKYFTPVSETGTDPRAAEAARAAAFAIVQSRGASHVRAMQRGAASSDANAPVSASSDLWLPIRSESNQPQSQPTSDIAGTLVVPVSPTSAVAPIIAASGPITAAAGSIIAASGPITTAPGSTTAAPDPTIAAPDPTIAAPDPTTATPDSTTTAPAPDPISHNEPSAATPNRGRGGPAKKVGGKRRRGKRGHKGGH